MYTKDEIEDIVDKEIEKFYNKSIEKQLADIFDLNYMKTITV